MLLLAGLKRGATLQTIPSPPPPGERLRGDGGEMEQIVQVVLKIHHFIKFYAIPPKLYFASNISISQKWHDHPKIIPSVV